jgi:selenocysteine-specific elongation factor
VPGHERFIKNMLAGVGGVDLAMLVVAADESVMPQTREHLAILDILQIRKGIVVITKTDTVDEELVQLVMAEVEDFLEGTSFEGCPMVGVSAYTGDGLDELKDVLDQVLDNTESRRDLGRPRLPVDRSFTITGFGTVVTGTLIDGAFTVGQEVELANSGRHARIRGLQSHKSKVDQSQPGVRLAVNLSGLSRSDVPRGEVLTSAGWLRKTNRLDARVTMVKGAPHALKHNEGVTFHLFTSETTARVRLLDDDRLAAGEDGWVQILLTDSLPMVKGDFFVIRSSEDTLGGGQVVDPNPRRRHRRFTPEVIERLMTLDQGSGEDVLLTVAEQWGPCNATVLSQRSNLPVSEVVERIEALESQGDVVVLGEMGTDSDAVVYSTPGWNTMTGKLFQNLRAYHDQYPMRRGAPSQEVRSRSGLSQSIFLRVQARLTGQEYLVEDGTHLRLPDHEVTMTPEMEEKVSAYIKALEEDPYSPPSDRPLDPELLGVLADEGKVVRVNESVVFASSAYQEMTNRITEHLKANGSITVAEARTMFDTSRKYILPLLEYMDQQRVTRRVGDERVLR